MNPMISVIVPVYNSEKTLERCLNSALNQNIKEEYEIILVDDGSTDNSIKMCQDYQKRFNNVTFISEEHRGVSHARNSGIRKSAGKYICFLDSDDYYEPQMLQQLYERFSDETDIVGTSYNSLIEDTVVERGSFYELTGSCLDRDNIEKAYLHYYSNTENIPCYTCLYMYRKSSMVLFDENLQFMEDAEFLSRLLFNIRKIEYTDTHLYNYCYNSEGITKNKNNVLSNIQSLTKAAQKMWKNLSDNNVSFQVEKKFVTFLCHSIVNKWLLLSRERYNVIENVIKESLKDQIIQKIFREADTDEMSLKMKCVVHLCNKRRIKLLCSLIKMKGLLK